MQKGVHVDEGRGGAVNRFAIGVICALVGAVCWGFSGTCAQFLNTGYDISPLFIVLVRNIGASLLFGAVLLVRYRKKTVRIVCDRATWPPLLLFSIVGVLMCQTTYVVTIAYTNAGTATVLQSLNVVIVLGYVCVRARRTPRLFEWLGVALALVATVLIATGGDLSSLSIPLAGLLFGLLEAVAVTFYVLAPKPLFERWPAMPVTSVGMLVSTAGIVVIWCAGCALAPACPDIAWLFSVPELDAAGVAALAAMGFVGTFAAFALYLYGVSIVGGVNGSLLGSAEPLAASVLAVCWLGTVFSWADWVGLVLMVATIFLVALQPGESGTPRKGKPHAASEKRANDLGENR